MTGVTRTGHRVIAASGRASVRWVALTWLVVRRLLWLGPVLLLVVVITFGLMHLAPGGPWDPSIEQSQAGAQLTEAQLGHLNAQYGLDQPWWEQLRRYLVNVVQFDFGQSYQYPGQQVTDLISQRWFPTFVLGVIALAVITPVGISLGTLAALKRNSRIDYAVTGLATVGASIPGFVTGILLIILLSVGLNRATGGAFSLPGGGFAFDEHLILPIATLSLMPVAFIARLTRSSAIETLGQDHVRTARAKGLGEHLVLTHHVVKNSVVPVVSALGPMFSWLVTGSVVVETLFQIRGLGSTFVDAVTARDYPVILALTTLFALVIAAANLAVDLLYVMIDPRTRPT